MGRTKADFKKELELRERMIKLMRSSGIRNFKDVAKVIAQFYARKSDTQLSTKKVEEVKVMAEVIATGGLQQPAKQP
jgi:hypothetical protein